MQKVITAIFIVLIAVTGFLLIPFKSNSQKECSQTYLRVHVRANSNSEEDQNIKYQIKDVLVSYLTPLLQDVETVEEAKNIVESNLVQISNLASDFLYDNGFTYEAKAKLNNEYFPTRSYEDLTLESGYYDALIVELGEAKGNNWWCVVYPPLCFSEKTSGPVEYSSIIAEFISRRKNKQ